MTECTKAEWEAEIKRIAADEPGWSDAAHRIGTWHWGWDEEDAAAS